MKSIAFKCYRPAAALAALMLGVLPGGICTRSSAQGADNQAIEAALPPGAEDAVKLTRAGLNEDIIIAQIKGSGASCQLSTDQILYLSNVGVTQNVIKTLVAGNPAPAGSAGGEAPAAPAPAAAPAAPTAPPAQVDYAYFHDQLSPYGNWVQVDGYGWCWNPTVATQDANWRPYCDQGQWVYTDSGWFWQSAYPWGDIPFHYGRWYQDASYGWLWVPEYTWAPAWVCWRNAQSYGCCGWAPLPPGARFIPGMGLYYNGVLAADIDFGLRWDAFIFVGFDHFWERDFRLWRFARERIALFYGRTVILNGYRMVGGRFVVEGLGRERIGRFTHRDVRAIAAHDLRSREERSHLAARRGEVAHGGVRGGEHRDLRTPQRPGERSAQSHPQERTGRPEAQHPATRPGTSPENRRNEPAHGAATAPANRPGQANAHASAPKAKPAQGGKPAGAAKPAPAAKSNNANQQKKPNQ